MVIAEKVQPFVTWETERQRTYIIVTCVELKLRFSYVQPTRFSILQNDRAKNTQISKSVTLMSKHFFQIYDEMNDIKARLEKTNLIQYSPIYHKD